MKNTLHIMYYGRSTSLPWTIPGHHQFSVPFLLRCTALQHGCDRYNYGPATSPPVVGVKRAGTLGQQKEPPVHESQRSFWTMIMYDHELQLTRL